MDKNKNKNNQLGSSGGQKDNNIDRKKTINILREYSQTLLQMIDKTIQKEISLYDLMAFATKCLDELENPGDYFGRVYDGKITDNYIDQFIEILSTIRNLECDLVDAFISKPIQWDYEHPPYFKDGKHYIEWGLKRIAEIKKEILKWLIQSTEST